MAAAAGATGVRTWLHTRGWTWLTPRRLRRITLAACAIALLIATVSLSGSTKPASAQQAAAPAASR
jgi:hypothetical protein